MKNIRMGTWGTLLALVTCALLASASASFAGTTIKYDVKADLTSTGVDTNAAGTVRVLFRQAGNSDLRRLDLRLRGLDPRTPYTVVAQMSDSSDLIIVTNLVTSRAGRANLLYHQVLALRSNGHQGRGAGVNRRALPDSISNITELASLTITDTNGQAVLTVNLQDPATLDYEVTTTFTNTGTDPQAIGVMALALQSGYPQFRLFATGGSSQYKLAVNDSTVASYQADPTGRIAVGMLPYSAPSPLLFRNVKLQNANDEVVLEANLR